MVWSGAWTRPIWLLHRRIEGRLGLYEWHCGEYEYKANWARHSNLIRWKLWEILIFYFCSMSNHSLKNINNFDWLGLVCYDSVYKIRDAKRCAIQIGRHGKRFCPTHSLNSMKRKETSHLRTSCIFNFTSTFIYHEFKCEQKLSIDWF